METSAVTQTPKTELDYTPLHETITEKDVTDYLVSHPEVKRRTALLQVVLYSLIAIFIAIVSVNLLVSFIAFRSSWGLFILLPGVITFAFLMVWAVRTYFRYVHTRDIRIDRFAAKNGVRYVKDVKNPTYSGMIFDEGDDRNIAGAYQFKGGIEIGNYHYVVGSGKNRSLRSFGYAKIPMSRSLPHMVLDARHNNFMNLSNLPDTFDRSQTLSLEGDFDTYFTLYAPKAYERDALYVFTPDVMTKLIDAGSDYDIEIIGQELYIYSVVEISLSSSESLSRFVSVVKTIADKLEDQSELYRDERVADISLNIVSESGAQLKKSVSPLAFMIPLVVAFYAISIFVDPMLAVTFQVISAIVFWGFVVYAIIKSVKRRRRL